MFKCQFFGYSLYLFKKKGENGACALIHPVLHTIDTIMQKINKKLSLTWLWGNIDSCNMTYQS